MVDLSRSCLGMSALEFRCGGRSDYRWQELEAGNPEEVKEESSVSGKACVIVRCRLH